MLLLVGIWVVRGAGAAAGYVLCALAVNVQDLISDGSLLIAVPVAISAGVVSFFSPAVLFLLPGYLGYLAGMAVLDDVRNSGRRLVLGACVFVAAFTTVFVTSGVLLVEFGTVLLERRDGIAQVLGVLAVALGVAWVLALRSRGGSPCGGTPGLVWWSHPRWGRD